MWPETPIILVDLDRRPAYPSGESSERQVKPV